MNTGFRNARSAGLSHAALMSAMLLIPLVSQAQVFFGSGGATNTAPNNVTNFAFGFGALAKTSPASLGRNTAMGYLALSSNTTAAENTAFGANALAFSTTGGGNTAMGVEALWLNSTGILNTAIGGSALESNSSGSFNIALGCDALQFNTSGNLNTATGYRALLSNSIGSENTANGYQALFSNTTANDNTATGTYALYSNTTGINNTANGYAALAFNITGFNNIANGFQALYYNTVGADNTANGVLALFNNATGSANVADGYGALYNNTRGSFNIALGYGAGGNLITGSNNIAIGASGPGDESGVIRIGTPGTHTSTYIAGVNGATASGGVAVFINASGKLGTLSSSQRFKNAIKDMGPVSDKLMQLRPVTFRYKEATETGTHPLQYGLIAEEVAKVYPNLVQYDKSGKPFTIYYHLLTPMLLNELQKEHRRNEAQKTEIGALKSELASLKQSQQQQSKTLARLAALMETTQGRAQVQRAVYMKH